MAEGEDPRKHSEESVKLFVGQVPRHMSEEQLLALFKEFALVDEVNVIKDKITRDSRGCCFVICPTRQEADKAVNACHNKRTLPGASSPLQVKYVDGELERPEHKLFVGMLPKNVSDAELSALFSQYGKITDLQILRGSQQTSKGCAFLKYETKEQALGAIEALNGKHTMEGSIVPLVVKRADTEKERQARRAQKAQSQVSNVPNTNAAHHPSLFGSLGMGYSPPYSGYGYQAAGTYGLMQNRLPQMQNQPAFRSIIPPVNQGNAMRGVTPNLGPSMPPRNFALPPARYVGSAYPAVPGLQYPVAYPGGMMSNMPLRPAIVNSPSAASLSVGGSTGGQVEGPPGANLFIYHIPQDFGDQELENAFQPFGMVLSAKVFVDKETGVSKCFGFVSYDSPAAAQTAINTMNGYQLRGKKLKVQLKRDSPLPKRKEMYSDPKSRVEEDSERLQLQVHQYSDPTIGISEHGNISGTAPAVGVLSTEELVVLNEKGEVVTQRQNSSPEYEDEESLSEVTEEEILLKELEETPSYPGELEELNRDPMEIPPTISHHFSILHVVDLSYTEINTLPRSISRLVALQKLYLRSCELLMELPSEIGELTNLEVLDLEGTEILCLPMEIAKLVKLTCLKVSFDGYANQTVIPRRVLSNLSRLKELIIDVSPYGEWWDVEVEAIIDDLRNLKELRSLKLYLPTAKLLEDLRLIFPGLANFRFTVGRHEEHFISRLPHDVEEEFNNREKLEKGLRYINGSRIPNEVTKVFKHANVFFLQRHWTAESLSDFGNENMNEVKFCLVMECNEFRTIIDSEQCHQGKDDRSESEDFLDFDEAIILGSLQKMIIRYMKNMLSIWKGPIGIGSLSNLKYLALHTCPNLTTLFTIDMLNNLINLEELIVEDCPKIDSLVSLKSFNSKSDFFLPNLKKISLIELPELVSISSGLWIAPKLERMVVFYCPKLEKLSTMDVSSTNLKVIKGEKEWWDALKWYESDLSTKHEDYLARLFIPLRMDGDLMAQLTKD